MPNLQQYLKDTRAELKHVAWPTRTQTAVYTILVAAISVGIALYLGFFDFLFTTGLARILQAVPGAEPATLSTSSIPTSSSTPLSSPATSSTPQSENPNPNFKIPG